MENNLDKQYTALLQDILDNGVKKEDRTGTGTISVFGRQIRHDMKTGFPLLTTKRLYFKGIVTELLWFLRGDTNIKFLVDNNCHIWDGDAYKNYKLKAENSSTYSKMSEEEFIQWIKMDKAFAKEWGELGPIYGKQWRSWNTSIPVDQVVEVKGNGEYELEYNSIDQIQNLINDLKTNPDSRRLMVNAWNVGELDQMVLPPCHYGFQVYTRELSLNDRILEFAKRNLDPSEFRRGGIYGTVIPEEKTLEVLNKHNIPTRAISLMWNQRSVDTFLGLPFNIASYGLLLHIIAEIVNMVPDELIGNLGDTHLYSNHIEMAKEQIGRFYTPEERSDLLKEAMGDAAFELAVSNLMPFGGGLSEYYDMHNIPHKNREPFALPQLNINTEFWNPGTEEGCTGLPGSYTNNFAALVEGMQIADFSIENYVSHTKITAPLSN